VFNGVADVNARIDSDDLDVSAESVLVLRGVGTRGAPGIPEVGHIPIPAKLARAGVTDMVRVTDARMSGTATGTIVLHVTPESAEGGPLALVRDGDEIELDLDAGTNWRRACPPPRNHVPPAATAGSSTAMYFSRTRGATSTSCVQTASRCLHMGEPTDGTIGFVGLGAMGGRMARRLAEAGHDLRVWNRSPAAAAGLATAESPAELAANTSIVIGCLLDDSAVERVYLADDGLLAGAATGTLLIEHGTFSPALAHRIDGRAAEKGCAFLDIPVTGGPEGAAAGTLIGMAGGSSADLDRARPVLTAYAAAVHLAGPVGSGLRLKLVNQLLVSVHMAAAAEAGALLRATGADPETARAVLCGGWAASAMLDRELPRILTGDYEFAGAAIAGLVHVQGLVAGAFAEAGISSRLLPPVRELFDDAIFAGVGGNDPAALVTLYGRTAP
jgi:3-hydroxyisobutyrate dehydrogenase-like beta-hydroxyacid dehydrogenase